MGNFVKPVSESLANAIQEVIVEANKTEKELDEQVEIEYLDEISFALRKNIAKKRYDNATNAVRNFDNEIYNGGDNIDKLDNNIKTTQKKLDKNRELNKKRMSREMRREDIENFAERLIESELFTEEEIISILEYSLKEENDSDDRPVASSIEVGHKVSRNHNGRNRIMTVSNTDKDNITLRGRDGKEETHPRKTSNGMPTFDHVSKHEHETGRHKITGNPSLEGKKKCHHSLSTHDDNGTMKYANSHANWKPELNNKIGYNPN